MDNREALSSGPPGGMVVGDQELCGVDGQSFIFIVAFTCGVGRPSFLLCARPCTR